MKGTIGKYICKDWLKIIIQFILLIIPIVIGFWIVLTYPKWISSFTIFYEEKNTVYIINIVFIIFVFVSLVPILINIFFYFLDSSNQINNYKGTKKIIKTIHNTSASLSAILGCSIAIFLGGILWSMLSRKQFINLDNIILFNGYLSIFIFIAFLLMDILAWRGEYIISKEASANKKETLINISFAKESIFFIDIPSLVIVSLSVVFLSKLENIDYYKSFLSDPKIFLKPVTIILQSNQKEVIELFPNGIETGIIMTSIIYSQILYFILKLKWDYIRNR